MLDNSPILLYHVYGVEVWGPYGINLIDKLRLRYYKLILGQRKTTPTSMVLGELGKFSSDFYVKSRVLNYWSRILNEQDSSFVSIIYRLLLVLHKEGRYEFTWIACIEKWLNELGWSELWQQQHAPVVWFKNAVRLRLEDQLRQSWSEKINN